MQNCGPPAREGPEGPLLQEGNGPGNPLALHAEPGPGNEGVGDPRLGGVLGVLCLALCFSQLLVDN